MQILGFLLVLSCAIVARGLPRMQNNIVTSIADYPYVVSLQYDLLHVCGGSILNDEWILTAGHCLLEREPELFKVVAGSISLTTPEVVYSVESIVIHEDYDDLSWGSFKVDNIGLVRLSEKIHFTNNIKAIALPDQEFTNYGQYGNFVGWSNFRGSSSSANQLHRLEPIFDTPENCCKVGLSVSSDIHICMATITGTTDITACPGDDGGPLVFDGVLVGIGLRFNACQTWSIPMTRVWHYKNWIVRTIKKLSPKPTRPTPPMHPTPPPHPTRPTSPSKPLKYRFYASIFVNGTIELISNETRPYTPDTVEMMKIPIN